MKWDFMTGVAVTQASLSLNLDDIDFGSAGA